MQHHSKLHVMKCATPTADWTCSTFHVGKIYPRRAKDVTKVRERHCHIYFNVKTYHTKWECKDQLETESLALPPPCSCIGWLKPRSNTWQGAYPPFSRQPAIWWIELRVGHVAAHGIVKPSPVTNIEGGFKWCSLESWATLTKFSRTQTAGLDWKTLKYVSPGCLRDIFIVHSTLQNWTSIAC